MIVVPTTQPTSQSLILTKDRRDDFWPEDEKTKIGNVCKKKYVNTDFIIW